LRYVIFRIKTAAAVILLAAMLSGCVSMYNREYSVVTEHTGEYYDTEEDDNVQEISNYSGMRAALLKFVGSATEYGIITTKNYNGDPQGDISDACREVLNETPLGVYAIDYISHVCTRILSYYRIEVSITYKRTQAEIDSILAVSSASQMYSELRSAALDYKNTITFSTIASAVTEEDLAGYIEDLYRNTPIQMAEMPTVTIEAYPSINAVQKIIEIKLNYSQSADILKERLAQTRSAAAQRIVGALDLPYAQQTLRLCEVIAEGAEYSSGGSTAYDALVNGIVDSEGYAMAYKLLCDIVGVSCIVIQGRLNSEQHFWNIVEVDGNCYHIDVCSFDKSGPEEAFLKRDSDMWGDYWWDTEEYPTCEGELTYQELVNPPQAENVIDAAGGEPAGEDGYDDAVPDEAAVPDEEEPESQDDSLPIPSDSPEEIPEPESSEP